MVCALLRHHLLEVGLVLVVVAAVSSHQLHVKANSLSLSGVGLHLDLMAAVVLVKWWPSRLAACSPLLSLRIRVRPLPYTGPQLEWA
jgi:hypothetical protein